MTYILHRNKQSDQGTFGQLFMDGKQIAITCELPWKDNHPQESCIPAGIYNCIPHDSPRHPDCWEITKVPNRSAILIHVANYPSELLGCVGVGDTYLTNGTDIIGVANSRSTLDTLREILPDTFTLSVVDPATA